MMGSLLVVSKGQSPELQSGVPYDMHNGGPQPAPTTITINNFKFIAPDGTNVFKCTLVQKLSSTFKSQITLLL